MDLSSKAHPAGCALFAFALQFFTKRGKGFMLTAKKLISAAMRLSAAMTTEPESVEITVCGSIGEKSWMLHEPGANKLDKERDRMKRLICTFLAFGVICSLAGCQKNALPQPDFPLEEDAILAALKQTGLPGVISESETYSSLEGHMAYALRDPAKTYGDTDNKVLTAGISSAITEGERFLAVTFPSTPDKPATLPFVWEDWKQQIVFATLLFGGFADEEEVYRAFSDKRAPEGEEKFEWKAQLPGGYCTVSYSFDTILSRFDVTIYESESLYQKMYQKKMEVRKEMERSPAQTPN